jgi:hypothetical protein
MGYFNQTKTNSRRQHVTQFIQQRPQAFTEERADTLINPAIIMVILNPSHVIQVFACRSTKSRFDRRISYSFPSYSITHPISLSGDQEK